MGILALLAAAAAIMLAGRKKAGTPLELKAEGSTNVSLPGLVVISPKEPSEKLLAEIAAVAPAGVIVPSASTPEEVAAAKDAIVAVASADWQGAVVSASLSGDAATLDTVAEAMTAAGLAGQAASVRALSDTLRQEAIEANAAEGVAVSKSELVALAPEAPIPPPDPGLIAAKALAVYLAGFTPWKENRVTVTEFQKQMGLSKIDGKYGPETAKALASYGIIPPAPYYWPAVGTNAAISDYRATLREKAASDPPRAAKWLSAADSCVR